MSFQSIIDGILGTATTCAFAKEEGGAEVAAGISVVGFIFDEIFNGAGGNSVIPPMQRAARRQDIKDAVDELEKHIDAKIWQDGTDNLVDQVNVIKYNMEIQIDQAGQKGQDGLLTGATPVWHDSQLDALFSPVHANPSDIEVLMKRLMDSDVKVNVPVVLTFCHAASVFFLLCKVGQVWEINNNFEAYKALMLKYNAEKHKVLPLQNSWDRYEKAHPGSKHGARPKIGLEPPAPMAGDAAIGSWPNASPSTNPASSLGYKHSYFANQIRGYLKLWKPWVKPKIQEFDKVWRDARLEVKKKRFAVQVKQVGNLWRWEWADPKYGSEVGNLFASQEMAEYQAEFFRGSFTQQDFVNAVSEAGVSATNPDGYLLGLLSRMDIDNLLATMEKWDEIEQLYNGLATANGKKPPADGWLV